MNGEPDKLLDLKFLLIDIYRIQIFQNWVSWQENTLNSYNYDGVLIFTT